MSYSCLLSKFFELGLYARTEDHYNLNAMGMEVLQNIQENTSYSVIEFDTYK